MHVYTGVQPVSTIWTFHENQSASESDLAIPYWENTVWHLIRDCPCQSWPHVAHSVDRLAVSAQSAQPPKGLKSSPHETKYEKHKHGVRFSISGSWLCLAWLLIDPQKALDEGFLRASSYREYSIYHGCNNRYLGERRRREEEKKRK